MKNNFKLFSLLVVMLISNQKSFSQGQNVLSATKTSYDFTLGILNSVDIGEQTISDANDNVYVVAETSKDDNTQGIYVAKYSPSGTVIVGGFYNNSSYKEYVKKLFFYNGKLYMLCEGIQISNGVHRMMLVSCTTSLTGFGATVFTSDNIFNPIDAFIINNYQLYVACQHRNGNSVEGYVAYINMTNPFLVVNAAFPIQFVSSTDSYTEIPTQMIYNAANSSIYLSGKILNSTGDSSTTYVAKLPLNLATAIWAKKGSMIINNNWYNTIAISGTNLFTAGCQYSGGATCWTVTKLNDISGATFVYSVVSLPGFFSEATKITFMNSSKLLVAGYAKNQSTNVYEVIVRRYNISLLGYNTHMEVMPFSSSLNDAVSDISGNTFVTGTRANGSNQNMFFYIFDGLGTGQITYRDSVLSRNAAGSKITLSQNGQGNFVAAVTGFSDVYSNFSQPHNYQITTKFYNTIPQRITEVALTENAPSVLNIFPNPTSGIINVKNTEAIKKVSAFDMQGRTVLNTEFSDESFGKQINLTSLPKGIYFVRVNDGTTQKMVKN